MYDLKMIFLLIVGVLCLSSENHCWEDEGEVHEIGCDKFELVVKSPSFVDKSLLIEKFFDHKRVYVTAPRSTGKSININMIKKFFEIEVDLDGLKLPREKSKNYEFFSNSDLQLKIYDRNISSFFSNEFGKYPVILMRFKWLYSIDYDTFIRSVVYLVEETFTQHEYLLYSKALTEQDKKDFKYYFDLSLAWGVQPEQLLTCMQLLTHLLFVHFSGAPCIVIADQYDTPIQDAVWLAGKEFDKIIDFLKKFLSNILESNKFVFLTGCLRQAELYMPNNIKHFPFYENHPFRAYYGFTENEVEYLTKKLHTSDSMKGIRDLYSGYNVPNDNLTIYNPYSIVNYFKNRKFENYWIQAEEILINYIKSENLEKIFSSECIRSRLEEIVNGKTISLDYPPTVATLAQVKKLGDIVKTGILEQENVNLFLYFLLDIGYLTATSLDGGYLRVKVPNEEVRQNIKNRLYPVHHVTTEVLPE